MGEGIDLGLVARALFPDAPQSEGPAAAFALADGIREALESDIPYSDQKLLRDLRLLSELLGETKSYIDALLEDEGAEDRRQDQ